MYLSIWTEPNLRSLTPGRRVELGVVSIVWGRRVELGVVSGVWGDDLQSEGVPIHFDVEIQ